MTPQQIVGIAARLFSIFLMLVTFNLFIFVKTSSGNSGQPTALLYLLPLVFLGVALFLWFFPMSVAHKLVPRTSHTNVINLQAREMMVVGSVILGLWAMVTSIPQLASLFILLVSNEAAFSLLDEGRKAEFMAMLVRSLMGGLMIIRPSFIADLASRRAD